MSSTGSFCTRTATCRRTGSKGSRTQAEHRVIQTMGFEPKPNGESLRNLLAVVGRKETINPNAFDAVSIRNGALVDLSDKNSIRKNIGNIVLIEIKTTSREDIGEDFRRYFFSISDRQLKAGISLGRRYLFCLFNLATGHHMLLTARQLMKKFRTKNTRYSVQL